MMCCRPPFVYIIICIYVYPSQLTRDTTARRSTWPPSATNLLNTPLYRCVQIALNVAHCSTEGYTPVGDSTILSDVICPTWQGSLSLFSRVKHKTHAVLTKQGLASLCSSKYVGVDGSAAIQCFVWLAIPSFCQPVKADCSSIIAQNVLALVKLCSFTVLYWNS